MSKTKKILALLLAGFMTMSLASCGGSGDSAASASGSSKEAGDSTSSKTGNDKEVELKMVFWDSNQEVGLNSMIAAFNEENPNIKVTVETIPWDEYWTKLQAGAQGGNMPDIVVMHPDQVENYAAGGMLMDLTDKIANSSVTSLDSFPSYINEDFNIDGKYYGIAKDMGTMAMAYNKDLFDKAGIAYPDNTWTWDTMKENAKKLTDKANDVYGFVTPNDGQNYYWNLIWQNGGELFDDSGKCTFDAPEVTEAMDYAVSFIKDGVSPTVADIANLSADEYFESGKAAMVFVGSWMMTEYLSIDGLNFDIAELPQGKQRAAVCSGMAFSGSANTKHPDEVWKVLEFLGSEKAQTAEAESGVAIPAYKGTQQPWVDGFDKIDTTAFVNVSEYGHTSPGLTTNNEASAIVDEIMPEIFALNTPVEDGCKQMAEKINALK